MAMNAEYRLKAAFYSLSNGDVSIWVKNYRVGEIPQITKKAYRYNVRFRLKKKKIILLRGDAKKRISVFPNTTTGKIIRSHGKF